MVDNKVEEVDHKVGQMETQFGQEIATLRKEIMSVREESRNLVEVSPIGNCPKVRPVATMNCKMPKFDGETSWELYRKQFEAAAVANGWTEHQKATELVLALRGKALEILQNIPECKQGDYYSLANALELRYGNKYLTQVYQSQLKSRAQGSSETLQEFGAEIARLIRLAYPQAPEEFLKILPMVLEEQIYSRRFALAVLGT